MPCEIHFTICGDAGAGESSAQPASSTAEGSQPHVEEGAARAGVSAKGGISKRMQRVLANRASAARSKDRKVAIAELEKQVYIERHSCSRFDEVSTCCDRTCLASAGRGADHLVRSCREELISFRRSFTVCDQCQSEQRSDRAQ